MNTATRLGAYGAGLALVFGGAFAAADAVVPAEHRQQLDQRSEGT